MHYFVKDTDFAEILKFLKTVKGIHNNNMESVRKFIEGVDFVLRTGCQWRILPDVYGHWRAINKRFRLWTRREIWKDLFEYSQKDPDMEWVMINSTTVRAHACSAGYGKATQKEECLGLSRGGFTTKIHALCDALVNPLKFSLTAGQRNDITQAETLTADIFDVPTIADKGYDRNAFVNSLETKGCSPEILSRKNRKEPRNYDEYLYRERHAIECFFVKIKHFRRIFSRFEKTAQSYLSLLYFVGALIWIR